MYPSKTYGFQFFTRKLIHENSWVPIDDWMSFPVIWVFDGSTFQLQRNDPEIFFSLIFGKLIQKTSKSESDSYFKLKLLRFFTWSKVTWKLCNVKHKIYSRMSWRKSGRNRMFGFWFICIQNMQKPRKKTSQRNQWILPSRYLLWKCNVLETIFRFHMENKNNQNRLWM